LRGAGAGKQGINIDSVNRVADIMRFTYPNQPRVLQHMKECLSKDAPGTLYSMANKGITFSTLSKKEVTSGHSAVKQLVTRILATPDSGFKIMYGWQPATITYKMPSGYSMLGERNPTHQSFNEWVMAMNITYLVFLEVVRVVEDEFLPSMQAALDHQVLGRALLVCCVFSMFELLTRCVCMCRVITSTTTTRTQPR
jgi:hypothetical protein